MADETPGVMGTGTFPSRPQRNDAPEPGPKEAGMPGGVGSIPAPTPTPTPAPTPPPTNVSGSVLDDLEALFPWLKQVGLPASWFQEVAASSTSDAEVVAKLRMTSQYKARFAGIRRSDGSIRMTEAQYISQEDAYRQVLRQAGVSVDRMDNPADFVGWFESEVDPNELKSRVQMWNEVKTAGQDMQDAFYVYANMRVSDEDLYSAMVDPAAKQRLDDEYNQKVASQPFDYATWITRATEAGLSRVAKNLTGLQANGVLTGAAVQSIINADPGFARTVMDAIYHGGDPTTGQFLNLTELMHAFEYAAIGAAAKGAGLELPTKDRIAEIRAAGVDRASAQKAYVDYGQNRNLYSGAVARSGGGNFTQGDFENAAFLGKAYDVGRLTKGLNQEASYGEQAGQFGISQNRKGGYAQRGLV